MKLLIGNFKGPKGEQGNEGKKGDNGDKGEKGERGSRWTSGTAITGTSTTETIFADSGITDAKIDDYYINTTTGNLYQCTASGAADTAKWVYIGNLKGPKGNDGPAGSISDINDQIPTYEESTQFENIESGEKVKIAFGKLKKALSVFIVHHTQKATAAILGHVKLSNSAAITKPGEYALDAIEKNATIEGTLAHLIDSQNNVFANQIQQLLTNMTVVKSDITYADGFEHGGNWGPNKLGSLLASYGKLKILKLNCKPIDDLAKNTWYPIILELQPLCACTDLINMCSAGRLMLNGNSHLYLFTNDVIPSGTWITGTFIFLS